jgi:hypothetical protein
MPRASVFTVIADKAAFTCLRLQEHGLEACGGLAPPIAADKDRGAAVVEICTAAETELRLELTGAPIGWREARLRVRSA